MTTREPNLTCSSPPDTPSTPSTTSSTCAGTGTGTGTPETPTNVAQLRDAVSHTHDDNTTQNSSAQFARNLAPPFASPTRTRNGSSISMSDVPDHMSRGQVLPPEGLCVAHRLAGLDDDSESESDDFTLSSSFQVTHEEDDDGRSSSSDEEIVFKGRRFMDSVNISHGDSIEGADGLIVMDREESPDALIGGNGVFVTNTGTGEGMKENKGKEKRLFNGGIPIEEFGLVAADNGVSLVEQTDVTATADENDKEKGGESSDETEEDEEEGDEEYEESEDEEDTEDSDDSDGSEDGEDDGILVTSRPSSEDEAVDEDEDGQSSEQEQDTSSESESQQPKQASPYKQENVPKGEPFPDFDQGIAFDVMISPPMYTIPVRALRLRHILHNAQVDRVFIDPKTERLTCTFQNGLDA